MVNIVLYEPEIPMNTGNIMRTCAATNAKLHLIRPLGFAMTDSVIKRSGVNYIDKVNYILYDDFDDFLSKNKGTYYYLTRYGKKPQMSPENEAIYDYALEHPYDQENITELKLLGGANIPNIGVQTLINHKILDYDKLVKYFHCSESKVVIDSEFENIIYNWFRSKKNEDIFETINLLKSNGYLQKTDIEDNSNKISYCISGEVPGFKSKGEFIQYLKEKKPELMNVSSVTTDTNYLISSESGTSKVLKAKRYGIPILNSSEFLSRFGIK